jgi:LmbE family N-acetylglucosaminyl deacetylase
MRSISRRDLLGRAGWLGSTFVAGPAATTGAIRFDGLQQPGRRLKVVVTGGHPGDPEYGCGGTIARYTDLGHDVVLLYLNDGVRPPKPPEPAGSARIAEAKKACEILKARPLFAGQIDGQAVVDPAHYQAFRKILEAEQPDAIFTHWPIDNHPDHRAISMLAYEAWLRMGRRSAFYYYEVSNGEDTVQFSPTHYVDITETEPRKRSACYAHASQSPDKFYALQERVTRLRGLERGCRQAESYIRHVQSPDFALPLAE